MQAGRSREEQRSFGGYGKIQIDAAFFFFLTFFSRVEDLEWRHTQQIFFVHLNLQNVCLFSEYGLEMEKKVLFSF